MSAEMKMTATFTFEVPQDEMLLILKALGGRLVKPEETEAAQKLCDRLTKHRITALEHTTHQLRTVLEASR